MNVSSTTSDTAPASGFFTHVRTAAAPLDVARVHPVRAFGALLLALVVASLVPSAPQRPVWLLVWSILVAAQILATLHWRWRGPLVGRGPLRAVAAIAVGASAGLWCLFVVEPLQRTLQHWLLTATLATPWEGMVAATVWLLLPLIVGALVVGAYLVWRALSHAVLDGRVSARAPFEIAWVATIAGIGAFVLLATAPAGLDVTLALVAEPDAAWWTTAAARLSLFVDAYARPWLAIFGTYTVLQLVYAWYYGLPEPTFGPVVLIDIRAPDSAGKGPGQHLLRFANAWGEERGAFVLVRAPALAERDAGLHAYWAHAADELDTLFVNDTMTARRWVARWFGAPTRVERHPDGVERTVASRRIFARECYATLPALAEWVRALCAERNPVFLLLADAAAFKRKSVSPIVRLSPLGNRRAKPSASPAVPEHESPLESLHAALPKQASFMLTDSAATGESLTRLRVLQGRMDSMRALRSLVAALEQEMRAPPPQRRVAVIGRPRSDALADRLVAALDRRKDVEGRLIDAVRPLRNTAGGDYDALIVLLDPAWLAGELEALAEARTLAPLTRMPATVEVVMIGTERATERGLLALQALELGRKSRLLGHLPDVSRDADAEPLLQRFLAGESTAWASAVAQRASIYLSFEAADNSFSGGPLWHTLAEAFSDEYRVTGGLLAYGAQSAAAEEVAAAALVVAVLSPQSVAVIEGNAVMLGSSLTREVAVALARGVPVLPLLLDGARLPPVEQLPTSLRALARLQAIAVDTRAGSSGVQRVVDAIRSLRPGPQGEKQPAGASAPSNEAEAPLPRLWREFRLGHLDDDFFRVLHAELIAAFESGRIPSDRLPRAVEVIPAVREVLDGARDGRLSPAQVRAQMARLSARLVAGDDDDAKAPATIYISGRHIEVQLLRTALDQALPEIEIAATYRLPARPDALSAAGPVFLRRAALAIVVIGDDFERIVQSPPWKDELAFVVQSGMPILPLIIDDGRLPETARLPTALRPLFDWQVLQLKSNPLDVQPLVERVSALLAHAPVERMLRALHAAAPPTASA